MLSAFGKGIACGAMINRRQEDARGRKSLKIAGFGLVSLLAVVLGLALVVVGIVLGVPYGSTMGGMVGLILGVATIVVALILKAD